MKKTFLFLCILLVLSSSALAVSSTGKRVYVDDATGQYTSEPPQEQPPLETNAVTGDAVAQVESEPSLLVRLWRWLWGN